MNKKKKRTDNLEVSSDQLKGELIEIKERVGALETITSLAHRPQVEKLARDHLASEKARQIMNACAEPRTREYLITTYGHKSAQALDYHLNPLRENSLIRQHFDDDGTQTFEWSNMFRQIPKVTRAKILAGTK
jgi:hypothetical protein